MSLTDVGSRPAMEDNGWEFHVSRTTLTALIYVAMILGMYFIGHMIKAVSPQIIRWSGVGILKFGIVGHIMRLLCF